MFVYLSRGLFTLAPRRAHGFKAAQQPTQGRAHCSAEVEGTARILTQWQYGRPLKVSNNYPIVGKLD